MELEDFAWGVGDVESVGVLEELEGLVNQAEELGFVLLLEMFGRGVEVPVVLEFRW